MTWADDLERGISDREGFAGDFARRILEERAAAHAQGRAAGREEAAKRAHAWADQEQGFSAKETGTTPHAEYRRNCCAEIGNTLREFAHALERSLP